MDMTITDFRGHLEAIMNIFTDNPEYRDIMIEELGKSVQELAYME
tara:strand:- start:210 stop:344 length:135 start_codon:yes stop_codon:yes gene_type:complete